MEEKGTKSSFAIQDSKEKLIIYFVGITFFLAVLVGIKELSKGDFSAPIFLGFFTGIYTLWRFCKKQKENPFSSIFKILKDDYVFDKYVTLKIFSIIFAFLFPLLTSSLIRASETAVKAVSELEKNAEHIIRNRIIRKKTLKSFIN